MLISLLIFRLLDQIFSKKKAIVIIAVIYILAYFELNLDVYLMCVIYFSIDFTLKTL